MLLSAVLGAFSAFENTRSSTNITIMQLNQINLVIIPGYKLKSVKIAELELNYHKLAFADFIVKLLP